VRRTGARWRIGVIGRISPEKGQADFLRAARVIHDCLPECQFVVCGAPLFASTAAAVYGREVENLAGGLPVEFTGWLENAEVTLATLQLLVVPSAPVDATPRVILEAFAAGVPVVAFRAGGIPELVEHNVTGFLVERRSPEALARAILEVLRDPERTQAAAERARVRADYEFSLERYQAQMLGAMEWAACG
jgi:glycosyltransferase involved in cell wall biosynthesis